MSKTGKSNYIYYNPSSSVKINGKDKAGVNINPWGTSGYYNMDDDEKKSYEYAGEQFALNLPDVNVFSADTQKQFEKQIQSYINQGVEDINDIYTPMLDDLKNDIASRFGNLDNSVFMDNLSGIEDKRADAVSDLAQNAQVYRQDLINNELANRYDYLDYLNNYRQQVLSNILNMLGTGQNLSNVSNSYYTGLNSGIRNANTGGSGFNFNSIANSVINKALGAIPFMR